MKRSLLSIATLSVTVTALIADTKKAVFSDGEVSGQIKAMYILHDKTNGFAPENGSAYSLWLKYVTPEFGIKGLKAGAGFYVNGDTGLTDFNGGEKVAMGMFTDKDGKTKTLLGQAYLEYKNKMLDAKVGRQILNTPLTKIRWSLMPNFYQAAVAKLKPFQTLSISVMHIDKMAYGSRSTADWGLIGEKTGTAGVTTAPTSIGGLREQARFLNLGTAAGVTETSGMSAINATYKVGDLEVSLWDYIAHDIANTIYAEVTYNKPSELVKGSKLTLAAQYLTQSENGDKLAGHLDFSMYGLQAKVGNKRWSAYVAYNVSADNDTANTVTNASGFFNAWGADPAYTSSIFSRNEYRQDVNAYKIGGHYAIKKDLKLVLSHADYGKSKTTTASTDATETDIILAYKPTKNLTLRVFHALRTSESDSSTTDKEMNHFRTIVTYKF